MEAPREPFSDTEAKKLEVGENMEETPQLTDKEIIKLFEKYRVGNYYIGVVPRRISSETTSGLKKPDSAVDREKSEMMREGVLLVAIGGKVEEEDLKIGDRIHVSQYGQCHQVIEEEGYVMNVFERGYICVIKGRGY